MTPRLQRAFTRFGSTVESITNMKTHNKADKLWNDLYTLALDRKNNDGSMAAPMSQDEEDMIIDMMVIS